MGILLNGLRRVVNRSNRGSITLEAAISTPLLLAFIVALSALIRLSMMEAGLRSAVNQATHQLAVQAYPLQLLTEAMAERELVQKLHEWYGKYESGKLTVQEWMDEYGKLIPAPVGEAVRRALESAESLEDEMTEPIRAVFQPVVAHYLPGHMDGEQLIVTALYYPIFDQEKEPFVKLEAEYEVPIHVPFVSRTITLRATAWERLWVGERK